ncbi:MAG: hypothetical protein HZC01_03895 [Candidatus Kerfeldbacteria bacterium]|nr:hypothetical protein [Candidatus Kerfeldbacteria bacterium]
MWILSGFIWLGACFTVFIIAVERWGPENARCVFGFSSDTDLCPKKYRAQPAHTFWGEMYIGFVVCIKILWAIIVTSILAAIALAIMIIIFIIGIIMFCEKMAENERKRKEWEMQQKEAVRIAAVQHAAAAAVVAPKAVPISKPRPPSSRSSDWSSSSGDYSAPSSSSSSLHSSDSSGDREDVDDDDKWRRTLGIAKCDDCNDEINDLHHGDIGDGKCAECQGDGHPAFMPDDDCYKCGGSGDCPSCNGKGYTED